MDRTYLKINVRVKDNEYLVEVSGIYKGCGVIYDSRRANVPEAIKTLICTCEEMTREEGLLERKFVFGEK